MDHENLEKCNKCGICNKSSPEYTILRKESVSPRFLVRLINSGKNQQVFYNLCSEDYYIACPVGVKINIIKIRSDLVLQGKETDANKRMRSNILKHKNPYGDPTKIKEIKQIYT